MTAFSRIFKYVLPQWPRIIGVVLSALIVATLLSLSFMTVIPLLKVMMGEEGLHGWVNRKISSDRYGVSFYVPEKMDFAVSDIAFHLLVTRVTKGSAAEKAGLKKLDEIIDVHQADVTQDRPKIASAELLHTLAVAPPKSRLTIQLRRLSDRQHPADIMTLNLETGKKPFYLDTMLKVMGLLAADPGRQNKARAVALLIMVMTAVTIVRCIAKFYQAYMGQKVVQVALNQLRQDAFAHIMDMPVGFFSSQRPSDVVSRLIRDIDVMGQAVKIMLGKALREPLNALFMLTAAMWLNWQLTLIFLAGAPLVLSLVAVFGKKMKRATGKSLVAWSQMLAKLQETTAGLRIVKVYNQQHYEREKFKIINSRLLKQLLKISRVDAATNPVMEVLGMLAGSAALITGAHLIINREMMDASEFFGLIILLGASAEAVRKTSDIWNKIQEANAAAERVFSLIDESAEPDGRTTFEFSAVNDKIEFRNIVFGYPGSDRQVLKNINLCVSAGQNVAIVGPNGSGKTTLANLIPRFYDPLQGQILIDGRDIRDATLHSLRSRIAMVTQEVVTFNDTIAANIAYGKPSATKEEIIAAAERAFAHEFIAPLPDDYNTVIGEHGTGLSGGQLQRIIIARAILKNPAILIFDEATSQVDADSEAKIHKAIEEIMEYRTTFLIAHRFSTVLTADFIVVMNEGSIVAQGPHQTLIETCPLYQNLYRTQLVQA